MIIKNVASVVAIVVGAGLAALCAYNKGVEDGKIMQLMNSNDETLEHNRKIIG